MGLNLADIGLYARGMNSAAAEFDARQAREEDRKALLERRRLEQERAIADQEERRRQEAYASEVRQLLPKFLSGGEQAIPAVPAKPAVELDARQQEGGDQPTPAKPPKPAQDNEAGLYEALQTAAAKHGRIPEYEATKKRLEKFKEEGVLDFIRKARQGATEDDLLEAFNKSGRMKLKKLRRLSDDEYVGVTDDDNGVNLNLDRMTEALMSPKELMAHKDRTADRERKAREAEARAEAARVRAEAQGKLTEANITLKAAQAESATARAERLRSGGGNPRRPGNWNQFDNQVKSLATSYLSSRDPDTGKDVVDKKSVVKLTSMASAIARQKGNEDMSPAEALEAAREKFDEVRSIAEASAAQAEGESAKLSFENEARRQKWIEDRAASLTRMRSGDARPAAAPAARAPSPRGATQQASAKAAPGGFKSAEEVREAYRAGRLSREQAKAALQSFGFK